MTPPFKKVTVHTVENTANHFTVYVNDLERILAEVVATEPPNLKQFAKDNYRLTLERALFIQHAIEEKIERDGR